LARILPVRFEAEPNALGIISQTILNRYPDPQKLFWFLFGVVAASLLSWLIVRVAGTGRWSGPRGIALEVLGACVLAAVLWLPALAGALVAGLLVAAATLLARRRADVGEPAQAASLEPLAPRSRASRAAWAAVVLLLAVYSSTGEQAVQATQLPLGIWSGIANVAYAVEDRDLVADGFGFHAEWGQHLAWADQLLRGDVQGRDFYSLYGPLYHLSLLGVWGVFGRSIAAFTLWQGLLLVSGFAALLSLTLVLVRRRPVVLAIPFLVPYVHLRLGLPLAALACLCLWRRSGRRFWCALAGAIGGSALFFSQEFGLAFLLPAVVVMALAADTRAALAFAATLAAVALPVILYFTGHGALAPMLADLVEYPRYVAAGFGSLPFAPLLASLPLQPQPMLDATDVFVRLGYSTPLICVAALLLVLPLAELDPRKPLVCLRRIRARLLGDPLGLGVVATGLLGLVAFRSALGRSDLAHIETVVGPAAALLCVGVDHCAGLWAAGQRRRGLAIWRSLALAFFIWQSDFLLLARPWDRPAAAWKGVQRVRTGYPAPVGAARPLRVVDYVLSHTRPEDPVLFVPNDASYYYLTQRANPTRFALAHQLVTDEHRREALDALRRHPPRLIVRDLGSWDVDGIPLERNFGPALMDWIHDHYQLVKSDEQLVILEPADAQQRKNP
jgi:hypothetical protein